MWKNLSQIVRYKALKPKKKSMNGLFASVSSRLYVEMTTSL